MAKSVGTYVLERLRTWGVERIFGYPGDGINGLMGAFHHVPEMNFVQVRHEEMAAFMACAHAKFTGEVGVCLATSGPGAIHLLNGLYDAQMDHQPVVAIVGQQDRAALGSEYQQEVDLVSLFKDVAHAFVQMATAPSQIRQLIDRAVRIALSEKTVTCVIIPKDVQELDAEEDIPHAHGHVATGPGFEAPRVVPSERALVRAADVLNEGKKVAILAGQGALGAATELAEVADVLGAGVAKALLGKGVLPDHLPWVTGSIGLLGTKPSWDMMQGCDTLLMVGSGFPYAEFLPEEGKARGVQIDLAPRRLSLRFPMEVALTGDSALTLRALLPLLRRKTERSWREDIEKNVAAWWKVLEARAMQPANPVNPQRVFWELSPRLPDRAIIVADSGTTANWFARDIRIRSGMMASLSGTLASMGPAVPYAIAAKFAFPDRVAVALAGDGAMQMNGLNELITIAKYWRGWADPRLVVLVLNNGDLNMVSWEQRAMAGDPKLAASQDLPPFPYAQFARSLGLAAHVIDKPEKIAPVWEEAMTADRPVLVEAICDPAVPPTPPHIALSQARALGSALLKGDADRWAIIRQAYRDMVASWKAP